jgi:hypothetical protein
MSNSGNTFPECFQAANHIRRDKLGKPVFPRVIEHPPLLGDVHPLDKRTLVKLLPVIPLRFLHGVSAIELRARPFKSENHPLGTYQPKYKLIRLYSQPFPEIPLRSPLDEITPKSLLGVCGVTLVERNGERFLRWPSRKNFAQYFFTHVFAHELGHHHVYQFKHKRRPPETLRGHEERADAVAMEINALARFNFVFCDDA